MSHTLLIHPAIEADVTATAEYYADIDQGLARRFADEFERTLQLIQAYPLAGRILYGDVRRMALDRFPYLLTYRIDGQEIRVQLLVHARRDLKWIRKPRPRAGEIRADHLAAGPGRTSSHGPVHVRLSGSPWAAAVFAAVTGDVTVEQSDVDAYRTANPELAGEELR